MRALSALVVLVALGCGPRAAPVEAELRSPVADAPYELASDQDLTLVRAKYEALDDGDAARAELRAELAAEYARRVRVALQEDRLAAAFASFEMLLTLWRPSDIEAGAPGLAEHAAIAHAVRDTFARAGGDIEAVTALAVLATVEPARAGEYVAEIEEIFAFADDLAVSEYGDGAQRSRPIEILETAAAAFPSRLVVDRLVTLYRERQQAIDSLFRRSGADIRLLEAHGKSVIESAWHIVAVLARAGRLDEALQAIEGIRGIGDDAELRRRLRAALSGGEALAWVRLAASFRGESQDLAAALAICRRGLGAHPRSAELYLAAADTARAMDEIPLAIRYYERGLAIDPSHQEASSSLAGLYEFRVTSLSFADRPQAARRQLAELERFHARAEEVLDDPLEPDLADAYAAMGRGLVSLGELEAARRYLDRSLELRPTLQALEHLGTVALKRGEWDQALAHLERALSLPGDDIDVRFDRLELLRLTADAYAGAGNASRAEATRHAALRGWNELVERHRLAPPYLALSLVERGKLLWAVGATDVALSAFDAATDVFPDGSALHADIVAFLLMRGEHRAARDVYHRAAGNPGVDDYYKVYMSLWLIADARDRNVEPDPVARELLAERNGRLWYDALARYATGRADESGLRALANTRGRKTELLYYTAVLGDAEPAETRRLLQGVVESGMVLFFEYEMAVSRLAAAAAPRRGP